MVIGNPVIQQDAIVRTGVNHLRFINPSPHGAMQPFFAVAIIGQHFADLMPEGFGVVKVTQV